MRESAGKQRSVYLRFPIMHEEMVNSQYLAHPFSKADSIWKSYHYIGEVEKVNSREEGSAEKNQIIIHYMI